MIVNLKLLIRNFQLGATIDDCQLEALQISDCQLEAIQISDHLIVTQSFDCQLEAIQIYDC